MAGLRSPGKNERLIFLQRLLQTQGINAGPSGDPKQTGVFILKNLLRVVQERKTLAERAAAAKAGAKPDDPSSLLDRSSLFRDRGVSLDTAIFPDFSLEQTLRDLKQRGVLREGQVARVAVIGPGLDFIDKNEASAYDYYSGADPATFRAVRFARPAQAGENRTLYPCRFLTSAPR